MPDPTTPVEDAMASPVRLITLYPPQETVSMPGGPIVRLSASDRPGMLAGAAEDQPLSLTASVSIYERISCVPT